MFNIKKKDRPFNLDSYCTRTKRVTRLNRAESIYGKQWFSNLIVFAFVCIDMFCLKVVWNLVQMEDPLFVYCLAFACAAALDVPLAIAAVSLKKYHQGLCGKKSTTLIVILSVIVFLIAFVCSFGFRIITKDLSFEIDSSSALMNTMAASASTNTDSFPVWIAAIYNGIVPLLTSLSSFIISYYSSSPLTAKLANLEKERIALQTNIIEIEEALLQAGTSRNYCAELIARENDLYKEFLCKLDLETLRLKQLIRVILMEKLSEPENITILSQSAKNLYQKNETVDIESQELADFVESQIQDREKLNRNKNPYAA